MAYTTIDDPSAYFKVQLYTGNGSANHAITFDDTDTDMQPDMVWIKNRDATDSHCFFDAVRGATKLYLVDTMDAETTDTDTLDSFTSDGFQVDADVKVNTDTEKYVAFCWKLGTTSGINTTGADITLEGYSFNQTSGVSLVTFTGNATAGDTIPHGLGAIPDVILGKANQAAQNWVMAWGTIGWSAYAEFTAAILGTSGDWAYNNTAPTSVLVELGNSLNTNNANGQMIITFAGKQGFSKMGNYEGNGNADGTFVYTGFRPAFVMTKSVDSTSSWHIFDNKREGYNVDNDALVAEATTAEATADQIDLLSNGFKCRIATDPNVAETFIYMAFAEAPFVNSNGVPCNAR
jgi:hypothetical protein